MNSNKSKVKSKILINFYKISGKLNKRNIDEITFYELEKIRTNIILIDVRSLQEYNEGHLNGAINIPLYDLKKNIYKYVNDKNRNIIVYCQTGKRSSKATKILKEIGFNNVYNLKGGLDSI